MPRHDPPPANWPAPRPRQLAAKAGRMYPTSLSLKTVLARRRRRRKDDGGEAVPVEPNRPNNLTGGAAGALEFDD